MSKYFRQYSVNINHTENNLHPILSIYFLVLMLLKCVVESFFVLAYLDGCNVLVKHVLMVPSCDPVFEWVKTTNLGKYPNMTFDKSYSSFYFWIHILTLLLKAFPFWSFQLFVHNIYPSARLTGSAVKSLFAGTGCKLNRWAQLVFFVVFWGCFFGIYAMSLISNVCTHQNEKWMITMCLTVSLSWYYCYFQVILKKKIIWNINTHTLLICRMFTDVVVLSEICHVLMVGILSGSGRLRKCVSLCSALTPSLPPLSEIIHTQ